MSDILAARINERMMDWVVLINESRIYLVKTAQTSFMLMLLISGLFPHREGGTSEKNIWTPGTAEKHVFLGFSLWVGIYLLMPGEVKFTVQLEELLHGRSWICVMSWEGSPPLCVCWTHSALLFLLGQMERSEALVRSMSDLQPSRQLLALAHH